MDIVQILFISAVIFPAVSAFTIMFFIKHSKGGLKKRKLMFEQKELAFREKERTSKKVISSLEKVVQSQDMVLEAYRDNHAN